MARRGRGNLEEKKVVSSSGGENKGEKEQSGDGERKSLKTGESEIDGSRGKRGEGGRGKKRKEAAKEREETRNVGAREPRGLVFQTATERKTCGLDRRSCATIPRLDISSFFSRQASTFRESRNNHVEGRRRPSGHLRSMERRVVDDERKLFTLLGINPVSVSDPLARNQSKNKGE